MSTISKSNKCQKYQQRITNLLRIEKHVLADNYFCTHVSHLLNFDMDDVISLDIKLFFHFLDPILLKTVSTHKKILLKMIINVVIFQQLTIKF